MKIIAHRKELFALEQTTSGFADIGKCKSLRDYEKMVTIWPGKGNTDYSKDEWKGLVLGEPFLNFWLYKFGGKDGFFFEGISTRAEDGHGVDAWARDAKTEERFAVNHKMFGYSNTVLREHTAGIAWAALRYGDRPMLVTTSSEVSIPVQDDIRASRGVVITRDHIDPPVSYNTFWKEYQEYLLSNFLDYKQKQQSAVVEAAGRANRPLEAWQANDLGILLS